MASYNHYDSSTSKKDSKLKSFIFSLSITSVLSIIFVISLLLTIVISKYLF